MIPARSWLCRKLVHLNLKSNAVEGHVFINELRVNEILAENTNLDVVGVSDSIEVHLGCLNQDKSLRANIGARLMVSGRQKMKIEIIGTHEK